jgi:predicted transcriptional regulator
MTTKNRDRSRTASGGTQQPRASVTFPPELYKTIEHLAKRKKVSIAWVVRDAVEKYVADQWPLLAPLKGE